VLSIVGYRQVAILISAHDVDVTRITNVLFAEVDTLNNSKNDFGAHGWAKIMGEFEYKPDLWLVS
jgi:hypothetical protein